VSNLGNSANGQWDEAEKILKDMLNSTEKIKQSEFAADV